MAAPLKAAEFFAGIGLVRRALEDEHFRVVFANDIEPAKQAIYKANFAARDLHPGDVRDLTGDDVPDVQLATASFPCTDLSLAGNRAGLKGSESSMFWQFARIIDEMGERRPPALLLENVPSWATSHGGEDLRRAIAKLNEGGYSCDLFVMDAQRFVPQSRPRLFIIALHEPPAASGDWGPSDLRPAWIEAFVARHPELRLHAFDLRPPLREATTLTDAVQRLANDDPRWWDVERTGRFLESLSPVQAERLAGMRAAHRPTYATAYRRTRNGKPVWEIRADGVSGCLRTARGGSSKQALVKAGRGEVRVRWMTVREYARLQGAGDYRVRGVSTNQALFGFGDAVCVPVIRWIAREYLRPALDAGMQSGVGDAPARARNARESQAILAASG